MAEEIPNKELVDKFVKKIIKYSDEDKAKISAAAVFAAKKHGDQRRKTNQPYITHPIAVAEILMQIGMDADTVAAGLLHDTIEDTDTTEEEISTIFGREVGEMVQAVTKISRITDEKSIQEAETIKKMVPSSASTAAAPTPMPRLTPAVCRTAGAVSSLTVTVPRGRPSRVPRLPEASEVSSSVTVWPPFW